MPFAWIRFQPPRGGPGADAAWVHIPVTHADQLTDLLRYMGLIRNDAQ